MLIRLHIPLFQNLLYYLIFPNWKVGGNRLNLRETRFVEFVDFLYRQYPQCFEYYHNTWTEKYDGEDGIFAIFIRTLIWNETASKRIYQQKLDGFEKAKNRFLDSNLNEFDTWVDEIIRDIKFGADGKGSHRDNRHKKHTARALRDYFNLMKDSQIEFLRSTNSFDNLFHEIKGIFSLGSLTTIDFLERLYRSRHRFIQVYPERFYLTGGGVRRGLVRVYPRLRQNELEAKGDRLLRKILEETNIPKHTAFFEVESILCISQKNRTKNTFEELLNGEIAPQDFARLYAENYCMHAETP